MNHRDHAALLRRVSSLEDAVARLQLTMQAGKKKAYGSGFRAGQRIERKMSFVPEHEISIQEAAAVSHRFARPC